MHLLVLFLSTPSARRATVSAAGCTRQRIYFYPRPPRGGRPARRSFCAVSFAFLSTPSARRATNRAGHLRQPLPISIHALREEGDPPRFLSLLLFSDFYPRPPRGGRPAEAVEDVLELIISIHALREEGDASRWPGGSVPQDFYPRPPRGGRPWKCATSTASRDFYPRPPRGGRLYRSSYGA